MTVLRAAPLLSLKGWPVAASHYVVIDFETRSPADLKKTGAERYFEHPDTGVWCLCYAVGDDGEVQTWRPGAELLPGELIGHVAAGREVVAHNAHFEMLGWARLIRDGYALPPLDPRQVNDTMARARALALPGSLEDAAAALHLPIAKDAEGRRVMLQLARPRSREPLVWWDDPAKLARLIEYCKTDVEVERLLHKKLPPLSAEERALWVRDWHINQRGVLLDMPSIERAAYVVAEEQKRIGWEVRALTKGVVPSAQTTSKMLAWLRTRGVEVDSLAKAHVRDLLQGSDLDRVEGVRAVVELRKEAAKASTAKLKAMQAGACSDNRARGLFAYHGAGQTGRWAGRRIQTQNMPRPDKSFKPRDAENVIDWLPHGAAGIRFEYGSVLDAVSWSLRSLLIAAPGTRFLQSDYSNIEGRVLAWLAGEEWKLRAFRDFDAGRGADLYKLAYSKAFGVPAESVNDDQRQIGKVMELALGYQGGHGAFISMGANYGLQPADLVAPIRDASDSDEWHDAAQRYEHGAYGLTRDEFAAIGVIVRGWRNAHERVVRFWYALNDAAVQAVRNPGEITGAGPHIRYKSVGDFLYCRLPSGRKIAYAHPCIGVNTYGRECVTFWGVDTLTRKWSEQSGYGGHFAENVTQAAARDILACGIERTENAGYPCVMHVHDEILSETPCDYGSLVEFMQLMSVVPAWAESLPVAVAGWEGERYRK